jgi:putative hemolysin
MTAKISRLQRFVSLALAASLVASLLVVASVSIARAMLNPAAVYCEACGYEYVIESTELGDRGLCRLLNEETVDAWDFLRGKVALEWSYCAQQGYEAKHVEDPEVCPDCTLCVLPNGTEVEVTQLMGLSFEETTCGDGTCGSPEDYETCPEDCPSGGLDEYCDGVKDGICDPDCEEGADPDCGVTSGGANWPLIGGIIAAVVVIATVITLLIIRRRGAPAGNN